MSRTASSSATVDARTTVLALHSSASGARQWDAWREQLPPSVELVAPGLIGYGANGESGGWRSAQPVSLGDEARRLAGLLERPGGVHLLGHSYGGAVALELALMKPGCVRSLTLYEPVRFGVLRTPGTERLWTSVLAFGYGVGALVRAQRVDEAAALFVDYWGGAGAWAACSERRRAAIAAYIPKVDAEFGALFTDEVPLRAWRRLEMPVRLLVGTRSPEPALRIAERLAELCPRGSLERLQGLGHMGPVEAPARVAAAVSFSEAPVLADRAASGAWRAPESLQACR
ncbi:alpha/beta fold hydrolase [Azohydromonas caseinilytica]|uniref:Alpha/beta hydrolase n=1 Tax=Azohydromonas caseinilytica TaxID=2728836 RepID=A0A848FHW7_9BURK|nr:alpha/beta hydrolase [Azohydromonas caseinilytica]NML17800.1 alpha/beta hydrolase [Azohydromonas caseinilytica]